MNKTSGIVLVVCGLVLALAIVIVVRSNAPLAASRSVAAPSVATAPGGAAPVAAAASSGNVVQKVSPDTLKQGGILKGDEVATSTSGNIMVSSPVARATIGNSVTISGSARVFENVVSYRVLDGKGVVLAEGTTIATPADIGQLGPFTVTATYSTPKTITGTIEVFSKSAKDGSVIDLVTIPVGFAL